jgi:hypothetical protein
MHLDDGYVKQKWWLLFVVKIDTDVTSLGYLHEIVGKSYAPKTKCLLPFPDLILVPLPDQDFVLDLQIRNPYLVQPLPK